MKTHLSTVIFNHRFTIAPLVFFSKALKRILARRSDSSPSAISGKDSDSFEEGEEKKGNSRRDSPGEKLPRPISHGQLPRRYSSNIDRPGGEPSPLGSRSRDEEVFTLFYNAIRQNQSNNSYCFLTSAKTSRRPRFRSVENSERGGSLETRRRIFPIDSIRQRWPRDTKRTCDRNIISSFHYVRRVENDQEWDVISCFEGSCLHS